MKKDNRFKKQFKDLANAMGFMDKPLQVLYRDPITKKESFRLVNNHKRFVDGLLALPIDEQKRRLAGFNDLQTQLENDVRAGKLDFNTLLKEAQSPDSSEENLGSDS